MISLRELFKDKDSDAALIQGMASGESAAFRFLIKRHLPTVIRTAERILGEKSAAEDVAQEVMVRLWKKAPDWDVHGSARLDTWLYRVTVNLCIDRCRERKHLPIDDFLSIESQDKSAITHVHEQQIRMIISTLFNTLSKHQRLVIVLSYYEGLSAPEIAEILETTPGAVAALLHRGRTALKDKLTELGIESWAYDKTE